MSHQPYDLPYNAGAEKETALRVITNQTLVQKQLQGQANTPHNTLRFVDKHLSRKLAALFLIDLAMVVCGIGLMTLAATALELNLLAFGLLYPMNLLLFFGSGYACRLYELQENRYVAGQFLVLGFVTLVSNSLFLTAYDVPASSQAMLLLGYFAFWLPSAAAHYCFGTKYSMPNTGSFFYKVESALKRGIDFLGAFLGLIALSPLLLVTAFLIRLDSAGSVIYSQTRVGEDEKTFRFYKFRSMRLGNDTDSPQIRTIKKAKTLFKLADDPRLTPVGRIIRKLSIDELPQLINVLKGEMSLVGPRPPLVSEFEEMNFYHRRKFEATPGLTGLWQVTGRVKNERDFDSVARYDIDYLENWSLLYDLMILLRTIPVVVFQRGAC